MIDEIRRIEAFTIEGITYHYLVEGICYAESLVSAKRGLEATLAMSSTFQAFLRHEFQRDLIILIQDSQFLEPNQSRAGHWKVALGTQEAMIRLASGGKSVEVLASKLRHELDHHFRFRTGELAKVLHKADGLPLPNSKGQDSNDPTYLTKSRHRFQKHFFDDMIDHLHANHIESIERIEDPIARLLFQKPIQAYFYPALKMGIRDCLLKKGLPLSLEPVLMASQSAERQWMTGKKPIADLISKIKIFYPALSHQEIREVISNACLLMRIEISSHHAEATQLDAALTQKTSPRLTDWLNQISSQREALLHPKPLPPKPSHIEVPVFGNIRMFDIHTPLPEVVYVTLPDVRQMGYEYKPECLKYVILETGELLLAKKYSSLTRLTPSQIKEYQDSDLSIQGFKLINDVQHPFSEMYNGDIVYFDPKSMQPQYIKIPVKHPEVARLQNVVAAGDAYVTNGRFCPPKQGRRYKNGGIDNWTGHYLVNGPHLKEFVEETFRANGYLEAKGCFYNRVEDVGRAKLLIQPNILKPNYVIQNPNVKPIETLDITPPKANIAGVKRFAHKGMVGLNVAANVYEYGDVPAGFMATAVEVGAMGAMQVLVKPLPLLPLTIIGAMPDVKADFEAALCEAEVSESGARIEEMSAVQQASQSLLWGNPWGADRGLTHSKMTPHEKAKIVMRADPAKLSGYFWQQVGQKLNEAVHGTGKIAAAVIAILNPFSSTTPLYAPDFNRFENQPGYIFIDALRWSETNSNYRPDLAQEICRKVISDILMANQTPPDAISLPPITNPIDPARIHREATLAAGYVGPKFTFKDNTPDWIKGVGVVGSLGTGWKIFVTTQLTWASFGAGVLVLGTVEMINSFIRKKELSKQIIRARNSRRVQEQCDSIQTQVNNVSKKIDEVTALSNRYFSETNPVTKQTLYTEVTKALAEIKAENQAQQDLNTQRVTNKDIRVDGHKIRHRTQAYCRTLQDIFIENKSVLDELEQKIEKHQNNVIAVEKFNREKREQYEQKQRITNSLSIASDVTSVVKNTLTLFMPEKPAPIVAIPMTKTAHITPANIGLWQQQKLAPSKKPETSNRVTKLPTHISETDSTKKQPVKAFKL